MILRGEKLFTTKCLLLCILGFIEVHTRTLRLWMEKINTLVLIKLETFSCPRHGIDQPSIKGAASFVSQCSALTSMVLII